MPLTTIVRRDEVGKPLEQASKRWLRQRPSERVGQLELPRQDDIPSTTAKLTAGELESQSCSSSFPNCTTAVPADLDIVGKEGQQQLCRDPSSSNGGRRGQHREKNSAVQFSNCTRCIFEARPASGDVRGGFCRLKHRHKNTDPKVGPGG